VRAICPKEAFIDLARPDEVFELFQPGESPALKHLLCHVDAPK
jgi:hypothetical protein